VCLGVMRRLMLCWLKGPLTTRLCARKTVQLSQKLMSIVPYMPREFSRKPRSVAEILRWKATEFRQFLLYTGPVVLLHILPETLYQHFLLLSVAISLLANPKLCSVYCDYANEILRTFVLNALALYGHEMMVYNVHALVHLADDVQRLGSVDEFSAFPFENALGGLKKLIRKPSCVLQQIVSRLSEKVHHSSRTVPNAVSFVGKKQHNIGPVPHGIFNVKQYSDLYMDKFYLSLSTGDSCVAKADGRPCLIRNILYSESAFLLVVEYFSVAEDFFDSPLPSSSLNVFRVSHLAGSYQTLQADQISYKFVCLPSDQVESFVVIPLIHVQ